MLAENYGERRALECSYPGLVGAPNLKKEIDDMCQIADDNRRAVWGYTFDEILEILQLLQWAIHRTNGERCQKPSEETVDALFGKRPVPHAIAYHMHQLLPVKIESIFGKRGGASVEVGKEMSANKLLGSKWWEPMKAFAERSVEDPQALRGLLNRLEDERHRLIAHREGKAADVTNGMEKNMPFIKFKASPESLKINEVEDLQDYFKACKYFCEHARDTGGGPRLPRFAHDAGRNT